MELVRIDRSTVKKNPNAGSVNMWIPGDTTITFEYSGKNLPDILKDENNAYILYRGENVYRGELLKMPSADRLNAALETCDGVLSIEENRSVQTFRRMGPETGWLFEYEDTSVTCGDCGEKVRHVEIVRDEYDEEECPLCGGVGTFDFKYEDICDVINKK